MADPTGTTIATANIDIRARMENFDRDLQSVTAGLAKLDQSTQKATKSTDDLARSYNSSLKNAFIGLSNSMSTTFDPIIETVNSGKKVVEEFVGVIEDAAKAVVSANLYQRLKHSAEGFGLTSDVATASIQRFAAATKEEFGGSQFDRTLKELQQAGNFLNLSLVQTVKHATDTEDRFRAVVALIGDAMQRGERLAALKLAESILPPELVERLRSNSAFLDEWLVKVMKVKSTDIISNQQLASAAELKRRMDAAIDTWNKVDFSKAFEFMVPSILKADEKGTQLYRTWVNIFEVVAKTADVVAKALAHPTSLGDLLPEKTKNTVLPGDEAATVEAWQRYTGQVVKTNEVVKMTPELFRNANIAIEIHREAVDKLALGLKNQNYIFENEVDLVKFSIDLKRQEADSFVNVNEKLDTYLKFRGKIIGLGAPLLGNFFSSSSVLQADTREQALYTDVLNKKTAAIDRLAVAMSNHKNIEAGMAEADRALGDSSKEIEGLFLRMASHLTRSVALEEAHARSIGQGVAAQAKLRVEMSLRESMELAAVRDQKVFIDTITMTKSEIDRLRATAAEQNRDVLMYTPAQIEQVKKLATAYADAAKAAAEGETALKIKNEYIALGLGLSREDLAIAQALSKEYPKITDALKSEKADELRANMEIRRSQELSKQVFIAQKGFSQEQLEIANKLGVKWGDNAADIQKALDSFEGGVLKGIKVTERQRDLDRERLMITQKLSAEQRAIADKLKPAFGPKPEDVGAALRSPFGQQEAENKRIERMNDLYRETEILKRKLSAEDAAIANQLKGSEMDVMKALQTKEAAEIKLQNDIKRTRDIQFEYFTTTMGLSENELKIVSQLKSKYGETAQGIKDALGSQYAEWIRYIQVVQMARDEVTSLGTSLYSNFVSNLRQGSAQGISQAQAWRNAWVTSLQQVIDKIIEMGIKWTITKATGALFSASEGAGAAGAGAALVTAGTTVSTELTAAAISANGLLIAAGAELAASLEAGAAAAAATLAPAVTALTVAGAAAILHEGGIVGAPAPVRMVPPGSFLGARHFKQGGITSDEVPIIAHKGEEVLRRDDPRHQLNGGKGGGGGGGGAPQINLTFHANGRMTKSDIREHGMTIAKMVGEIFTEHHATRPKY